MRSSKVKDLMVPLADYATVHQDATLQEAVAALEAAQDRFQRDRYKHRAVLVLDDGGQVVGKLSQLDVIRALEPRYGEIADFKSLTRFGLSDSYMRSMVKEQGLWQKPLDNLCRKAMHVQVKDIMYAPSAGEYVDEEASLDEAIHQLVMGHHQSLLVTRGAQVVGILRLADLFARICSLIRACEV